MLKKLALLAYILSELKQINGKKALQKIVYFASKTLNIDYHYKMYWYGPFSKELAELLDYLLVQKIITFEPQNHGVKILFIDSKESRELIETLKKNFDRGELESVRTIIRKLSKLSPRELELMATIDFIRSTMGLRNIEDEIRVLKNLKGKKFSDDEISRTMQLLSELFGS